MILKEESNANNIFPKNLFRENQNDIHIEISEQ